MLAILWVSTAYDAWTSPSAATSSARGRMRQLMSDASNASIAQII